MAAIRTRRGLFDVPQLACDVVQQALLIRAELFAEQGGPDICRKLILAARVHYRRGGILGLEPVNPPVERAIITPDGPELGLKFGRQVSQQAATQRLCRYDGKADVPEYSGLFPRALQ